MSRWLRAALLYFEGLSTIVVGLLAVISPELVFDKITDVPADAAGVAVARLVGTAWVVIGAITASTPRMRDIRALRVTLLAIMLGDILHVASIWPWDAWAMTHVIPMIVYFINRGSIVLWPESFVRPTGIGAQPDPRDSMCGWR